MRSRLPAATIVAAASALLFAACVRLPPDVAEAMSPAGAGNHYFGAEASCNRHEAHGHDRGAGCETCGAR